MRAGIALLVWFGLVVGIAHAADKPLDDDAYVLAQLDAKLPQFDRDKLTIPQALKYLADMGQINIYLQEDALAGGGYDLEKPSVYVAAKGITLRECINRTVKTIDHPRAPLRWVVESGVVIVSTTADKNWAMIPDAANKFRETDVFKDETVLAEVSIESLRLEEALKLVREQYGVNVFVHWQALADLKIDRHNKLTLMLSKARPKTVMQLLVRRLAGPGGGVSYVIYDGVWVISTPKDLYHQQTLWGWRPQGVQDQASANKLANVLDTVIINKPFAEAIEDLGRLADCTMDVNWPDVKDAGVERDTPASLHLKQVRFSTALDLLLTDVSGTEKGLDYTAKDSTIHVVTKKEPEKPATRPAAAKPRPVTGTR
jgi:hypothetical protein